MAGLIHLELLTDFFNKIGPEPTSACLSNHFIVATAGMQ